MAQREHRLSIQERKEIAFRMFSRGRTNSDVRDAIEVSRATVARYRDEYEEVLSQQADANPDLLNRVVDNTIRTLNELDEVRAEAWAQYEEAYHPAVKQGYLKTVLQAQKQRAELFGLFGVKAEYLAHVNMVKNVQDRLLEFMRDHLCDEDREKLEEFMAIAMGPHIQARDLPAVDANVA